MNIETIKTLVNQLNDILADYDAKALESKIASIPTTRERICSVKSEEYSTYTKYRQARIDAAGGSGNLDLFLCNSNPMIIEQYKKQSAATIAKRNRKFAIKLEKAGVSSVESFEGSDANEGFCGNWKISTDKGIKNMKIQIIIAGGFVQCFHYRVLIYIK